MRTPVAASLPKSFGRPSGSPAVMICGLRFMSRKVSRTGTIRYVLKLPCPLAQNPRRPRGAPALDPEDGDRGGEGGRASSMNKLIDSCVEIARLFGRRRVVEAPAGMRSEPRFPRPIRQAIVKT